MTDKQFNSVAEALEDSENRRKKEFKINNPQMEADDDVAKEALKYALKYATEKLDYFKKLKKDLDRTVKDIESELGKLRSGQKSEVSEIGLDYGVWDRFASESGDDDRQDMADAIPGGFMTPLGRAYLKLVGYD